MSENTTSDGADQRIRSARVMLSCIASPTDKETRTLIDQLGPAALMQRVIQGEAHAQSKTEAALCKRYAALGGGYLDRLRGLATQYSIGVIVPEDPFWPRQLDELPDAPLMLYFRGARGDRTQAQRHLAAVQRSIAVIGSRAITEHGREAIEAIVPGLSKAGATVISGAALGVDRASHQAALNAGAHLETPTIAVLANGLDAWYPRESSHELDSIVERGLVLSENPPGAPPRGNLLMARNRLIVALSQGTVAIEAGERSGSLNAVRRATSLNRVVMRAAQPLRAGASAGTQALDLPVVEDSEQVRTHIRASLHRK